MPENCKAAETVLVPDLEHETDDTEVPVEQVKLDGKVISEGNVNFTTSPFDKGALAVTLT